MKGIRLAALIACSCLEVVEGNPCKVKGTRDILKEGFEDLSIIHGAIAWGTGKIQHMYDYGALGSRGDKIDSDTITLVHKLFHRPPGTEGESGFLVTRPVREMSNDQVVEFTASLLVFFKGLPQNKLFQQYQIKDDLLKKYQTAFEARQQTVAVKNGRMVLDKAGKKLEKDVADTRRLILTMFDSSNHPQYESPLKELAHYPIKAFLEGASHEYLPLVTSQTILQALLYKKTECDRVALRTYYTYLQKHLDCLAYPIPSTWEVDVFSPEQRQLLLEELQKTPLTDALLRQRYEEYVFLKLSPTEYPPLVSYGDAMIQGAEFPDCMDSALRNCLNFLAYNPQSGKFETSLLEQRLGTTVHARVKSFYEKHAEPLTVADKTVRSGWASMVSSNIPHLVYCRALPMLEHGKKDCLKIPHMTDATTALLAKKGYVALPESSIAYDMRPSLKNFILASDYLLGLQLFASGVPDDWTKEGFVRTYLPKVLTALKVPISEELDFEFLDKNDGALGSLSVPLSCSFKEDKPYVFSLKLHIENTLDYSEGEMLFNNQAQSSSDVFRHQILGEMSPESLLFLDPHRALPNDASAEQALAWLFKQDLDDHNKLFTQIEQLPVFNEQILKLLLFCAHEHKNETTQSVLTCRIYQAAVQRGLVDKKNVIRDAVATASEAVRSKNMLVRGEALQLFKTLLSNDKGVEQAMNCADELMRAGDRKSVSAALALYTVLAEHDKVFGKTVKGKIGSVDKETPMEHDTAFDKTAKEIHDKIFDKVTKGAQQGMQFNGALSAGIRFEATKLYEQLMQLSDENDGSPIKRARRQALVQALQSAGYDYKKIFKDCRYGDLKNSLLMKSSLIALAGLLLAGAVKKRDWIIHTGRMVMSSLFNVSDIDSLVKKLQTAPLEGDRLETYFEEDFFVRFAQSVPLATSQDSTFKGQVFSDSMDTAVRNIVNVLAYNPEIKRFDVSILEQKIGKKVRENLKRFYELNADPAVVNSKAVHTSWVELVSANIPLVAYNRSLIEDASETVSLDKRGFIKPLHQDQAVMSTLIDKGYVPVPEETDLFSVKSSLKNVIVILDHLFSLELCGPSADKEVMRDDDDFVARYLPKLATALHATVPIKKPHPLSLPVLMHGAEAII